MMKHPKDELPVNPLPPVVVILALAIVAVELIFVAASNGLIGGAQGAGWRITMIEQWGFREPLFRWMVETGQYPFKDLLRFVTYPFLHLHFSNLLFAVILLLAFGKMVAERLNAIAVLAIYFGTSIAGALSYWAVWDTPLVLYGGHPAAYGLLGAYTFLTWQKLGDEGQNQLHAFRIVGALCLLQLVFGVLFGASPIWVAEAGSFFAGFGMSIVLAPGGWSNILGKLRKR